MSVALLRLPCRFTFPRPPSPGSRGRVGHQYTRKRLLHRYRCSTQSRILVRLGVPQYDLDVHDLLPRHATRKDSSKTPRERVRVPVLRRHRAHRRVGPSVHALWYRIFGGVGGGESDVDSVDLCVFLDDGTFVARANESN